MTKLRCCKCKKTLDEAHEFPHYGPFAEMQDKQDYCLLCYNKQAQSYLRKLNMTSDQYQRTYRSNPIKPNITGTPVSQHI